MEWKIDNLREKDINKTIMNSASLDYDINL